MVSFYNWNGLRCAYQFDRRESGAADTVNNPALLLIHPIGVGLSGWFWQPFIALWQQQKQPYDIYNPDLLGCGDSDMPRAAYYPEDWAAQLKYFIETEIRKPVVLVVQGALFPVALSLLENLPQPNYIQGIVLSGPPAWSLMATSGNPLQQKILWNVLFDSPVGLGNLFYRYARRRQFLKSFSIRQLFAKADDVGDFWLDSLQQGARNPDSRYAVFSFLAGFWRRDYQKTIESISVPTLVVFGAKASSISREGSEETPQARLDSYLKHIPDSRGTIVAGRNIPPYEATDEFVKATVDFLARLSGNLAEKELMTGD
jgi:pimeloyl-ACP methyl ester carboxylesterase